MARREGYVVDGVRLAQARQALPAGGGKPVTQADFAALIGVHRVTLTKIENGDARVSLDLLERIVAKTGQSREWFLGAPEQVDPVEESRLQVGAALAKIAAGFEELTDVLGDRVREAAAAKVAV